MKKKYIICDIDGTIADNSHRAPILQEIIDSDLHRSSEDMKDDRWTRFYDLCPKDSPIMDMRIILNQLASGYEVVYLTGRVERIRRETSAWLTMHQFPFGALIMRENDDFRPNAEFKVAALTAIGLTPERVLCILEDNDADKLRKAGYRVLHVAESSVR